jgi:hypothetical protein
MTARLRTSQRFWAHATIAVALLVGSAVIVWAQVPPTIEQPKDMPKEPFPIQKEIPAPVMPAMPAIIPPQAAPPAPPRFNFKIDPKTPVKELLPTPPQVKAQKPSAFVDSLADVPELMLAQPLPNAPQPPTGVELLVQEEVKAIAHQIAKINHLNKEKSDRFMELLLAERPDLAGLPVQMGDQCRLSSVRSQHFSRAVAMVHGARTTNAVRNVAFPGGGQPGGGFVQAQVVATSIPVMISTEANGSAFLLQFLQSCIASDDAVLPSRAQEYADHAVPARLAAMTQICGPTSDSMKMALAKYLASVSTVEATQALVKTILFTREQDVRDTAIAALKARRESDWTEPMLQGFRYPWPEVASRAADALVKLNRKDLVPKIIDVLDEADPRAPVVETKDGKAVTAVRELVRINHHRNCLMCHPPGQSAVGNENVLTAEVPLPGRPLPSANEGGYRSQGIAEILVRIDVTYLRQDFSIMLPVADAAPWPEMQRFDFVVRKRVLKDDEAGAYKAKFDKLEPGVLPPNHRAALVALRELTGKDTAPTAEAWRKLTKAMK